MKLSHIRDVLAVAEFGSLRAAGRHLGIAQPAVSRSVHEIERELGVSLFERHPRGVRLTPVGQVFVRRAEAAQTELRRASEEIEHLKGRSTGQVSVALSSASAIALMPGAVELFRKRFPDAVLKISESLFQAAGNEIMEGRLDFYVGPLDPAISPTRLSVERLFDIHRVVAARKGHPLAGARSLRDLNDAEWVHVALSRHSGEVVRSETDFAEMFENLGLPKPRIVMHARSAFITQLAVASSNLLAILPEQWLETRAAGESLVGLDLAEPLPGAPVCIVRRHDMPLTPMAEYLCDMMRRAAGHYNHRRKIRVAS